MNNKKTIGIILKLPLILLIIGSFCAGVYAWIKGISNITVATPIILGTIIVLYLIGNNLLKSEEKKDAQ